MGTSLFPGVGWLPAILGIYWTVDLSSQYLLLPAQDVHSMSLLGPKYLLFARKINSHNLRQALFNPVQCVLGK